MKFIFDDDITIFISKEYINNIDLKDKNNLEKLIKRINDKYNIELNGYIEIKIYRNKLYGLIINIKKEDLEYFEYFKSEPEMNIQIEDSTFLYKIDDFYREISNDVTVYKDGEDIYIKPNNEIFLGRIVENSKVIYGDIVNKIIKRSKIINAEVITWKDKW